MLIASFFQSGNSDTPLFTEHLDHVPRIGDHITYSFEPIIDAEVWNPDVLKSKIHASSLVNQWVVIDVLHMIRRISPRTEASHKICVIIERSNPVV